jgi:hypothetical protein
MKTERHAKKMENRRSGMTLPLTALGIAGTLYAVSLNRRRKTAASSHSSLLEAKELNAKSIKLAWPGHGGHYRAFRDHELIYEGLEPKLVDQNLVPGSLYTYCIERLDEQGNVAERMKIQTTTSVDYKEKENILQDLLLTTIVAKNLISLEWEPIEGVSEYTIYRNGVKLDTIHCCSFTDQHLDENEEYTYTIKAKRPLQRSDQLKWEVKSLVANAVGAIKKDSSTKKAAEEEFSITKKIGAINQLLKPIDSNNKNGDGLWQLRYTTFIKEEYLKNPNSASADQYFKGDHRSFDPESPNFRTRADVFIDSSNPSALLSKETGKTEALSKNHELIEDASASDEDIKLEKVLTDDGKIMFYLTHSVSNPLVVSPAIDYLLCGTFYKDSEIDIVGIHHQAPNHEIYLKEPGTENWQVIHQAESKGLEMMANTMANHYWRYSTFTN